MSSVGRSATPRLADPGAITDDAKPSRYLTDGVNLYRYMGTIPTPMGHMIGLEDCHSLDVTLWPDSELRARQLQPVTPAGAKQQTG
jgi:hypothetical protein